MDNLTHSLVGVVTAELAQFSVPVANRKRLRLWLQLTAFAANNLPDFDFFYTPITAGKLGYLLHHRGYTHTFGASFLLSLLVMAAIIPLARLKKITFNNREKWRIYLLAMVGIGCHVLLDSMNVYGVHGLWPLSYKWWAADALYIVEPLIWFSLIPLVIFGDFPRFLRWAAAVWELAGLLAIWCLNIFAPGIAIFSTLFAIAVLALCKVLTHNRVRIAFTSGLALFILLFFVGMSAVTKERLRDLLQAEFKGESLNEIALSPFPANPFCWSFTSLFDVDDQYIGRRGYWASFPGIFDARACHKENPKLGNAPNEKINRPDTPQVRWIGQYRHSLKDFRELAHHNCGIAAFLVFSRAPFIIERNGNKGIGDLRFDTGERVYFAFEEFRDPPPSCPKHVPPWEPWRRELFSTLPN